MVSIASTVTDYRGASTEVCLLQLKPPSSVGCRRDAARGGSVGAAGAVAGAGVRRQLPAERRLPAARAARRARAREGAAFAGR